MARYSLFSAESAVKHQPVGVIGSSSGQIRTCAESHVQLLNVFDRPCLLRCLCL